MDIDGKALAGRIKRDLAKRVKEGIARSGREPQLAVILVGDDPSSVSYVAGKAKACVEVGIRNTTIRLPESITQDELIAEIERLNADPAVDGILVQLPLPRHIRKRQTLAHLDHRKDVDGFHPLNVAAMWQKLPCVEACTPRGIITMLLDNGIRIEGRHAVVVGRSSLVGYPVSKMLLDRNATVTVAHSHTPDLGAITRQADILVVAIGQPHLIKGDMVKEGCVVVDVGISRDPETGKYVGDVDYAEVAPKASYITPVPGGVGPMTIASLMQNTVDCYLDHIDPRTDDDRDIYTQGF
ncbi:MAG: bifunctional methylenetetrahydrofolate dehydrogenase/methenyltetrahydrofolate cyclohydrolase FolD [Muribaculaceae bacterium]|nr:bifunctional methylenetetrahydrofolate dehydrogenase/methenyltetrahydrofolate cyclohydrolase FolD [Muribaculaceae bacterium]